jgi:hypothetical protein
MDWFFLSRPHGGATIVISYFLIIIGLFLIFRWFVLWYWKINRIVTLLEHISIKLNRLPEPVETKPAPPQTK